jgi:hypothetical protein
MRLGSDPLMKALEFQTRLNRNHTLTVPSEVAQQVPQGQPIRVILLIPASTEDQDWAHLTTQQFLKGYAKSDAIYDKLSAG